MIVIDGHSLTLAQLEAVAVGREPVGIAPEAWTRMEASRRVVEEILRSGRVVYGVNTGFGKLSTVTIPLQATRELQVNLVRSHAAGVGEPLRQAETRARRVGGGAFSPWAKAWARPYPLGPSKGRTRPWARARPRSQRPARKRRMGLL